MMTFPQHWAEEGVEEGQEVQEGKIQQQEGHLEGEEVRNTLKFFADIFLWKDSLFKCFHQVEASS